MNNAIACSTVEIWKTSRLWFSGWTDIWAVRGVLTCFAVCSAQVRVSRYILMIGAGKVIALLTYPELWRNGCDCWDAKATGSCVVQSAGSQCIQNHFCSVQTRSSDWTALISPSANSFFPVLSTPKLHCSSNLRCEKEHMIYCHNCRPAISLRSLWRRKITAPYWENRYAENDCPKVVLKFVTECKINTLGWN